MSYVQKLLDNVKILQSNKTNLEIELKFIIDPRINVPKFIRFKSTKEKSISFIHTIIDKFKNTGSIFQISETINFIESSSVNNIKQLVFENGVQIKDKKNFYTKKSLTNPVFIINDELKIPIKLSISEEKVISEKNIKSDLVRAKLRLTILPSDEFENLKEWKIDITLIKSLKKISSISEIKKIRDSLFPKDLKLENFMKLAPWSYSDTIELEIESLNSKKVSEESISGIIKFLISTKENFQNESDEEKDSNEFPKENMDFQSRIYEIAKLISPKNSYKFRAPHFYGLKSMSNNVIELTRNMYFSDLQPVLDQFLITDKADGERTFIYTIPNESQGYSISSKESFDIKINKKSLDVCVADAEKIGENYLIFDVMIFNGEKIYYDNFSERKELISMFANLSSNFYAKKFVEPSEKVSDVVEYFNKVKRPFSYNLDGIIFTKKMGIYNKTINYKWKPIEETTIDFLIKECPKYLMGIDPYVKKKDKTLYLLFSGIDINMMKRLNIKLIHKHRDLFPKSRKKKYIPIQFSPSSHPYAYLFWSDNKELDNKICEMHYNLDKKEWSLHKIRKDKQRDADMGIAFGNDFRISELIWQNYFNPITMKDLSLTKEEGMKNVYFKKHDVDIYKPLRTYNSYVKEQLFKPHKETTWAIDIASGKGQDLFRYIRSEIPNVLFIDIDKTALYELISRKYSFSNPHSKYYLSDASININILEANVNDKFTKILKKIKENKIILPFDGVPLIVCNFAIHYMVGTKEMRKNFVKLIDSLLASKGRFIFTTFDGKKVFDLLKKNNGEWNHSENGKLKYSIKKDYNSNKFTGENQKIKLLQPFSEDTYYSEYLVNNDTLEKEFKKVGINQELCESFEIYSKDFQKENKKDYDLMSDADKMYSYLYNINVYYKN